MPCRSIVPNGAAWAPSAGASRPATARSAACRSNRRPTNTAISNIICPMSATDCRFPVRGLGHEHDPEKHALGLRPDGLEPVFRKVMLERKSKVMRTFLISLSSVLLIASATSALATGSESDFKTAYAAAEAANKEAGSLRNQWTVTAAALTAAKKAADAGDFDQAV